LIKIISLTDSGLALAERLAPLFNQSALDSETQSVQILHKPQPFKETVQESFTQGHRLIFICATGIVVRTLAPVINDKKSDPAVLVLDEQGQFVIPLLSGHEGGANDLAAHVANLISAQLVATTVNKYQQPLYTVGMGCERGCPKDALLELLEQCLAQAQLNIRQISAIASIDIKADEQGLIELAAQLELPFICYSAKQLTKVESLQNSHSEYVFKTVGATGVAEPSALLSAMLMNDQGADRTSELALIKQKSKVATCAIARSFLIP
jgi:cobalt-precorrin 5A hydrolase